MEFVVKNEPFKPVELPEFMIHAQQRDPIHLDVDKILEQNNLNNSTTEQSCLQNAICRNLKKSSCFSASPPKNTNQLQILQSTKFFKWNVVLKLFYESREIGRRVRKFEGQNLSKQDSTPPGPWELDVFPDSLFETQEKVLELPSTGSVLSCPKCIGQCTIKCTKCKGHSMVTCGACHGAGKKSIQMGGIASKVQCKTCSGVGKRRCPLCQALATVQCPCCHGEGQLYSSTEVRIYWFTKTYAFNEMTDLLPEYKESTRAAYFVHQQDFDMKCPFTMPSLPIIDQKLSEYFQCQTQIPSWWHLLKQRLELSVIPVVEVRFIKSVSSSSSSPVSPTSPASPASPSSTSSNDKNKDVYTKSGELCLVYGKDNKVYFPNKDSSCQCRLL